MHLPNARYMNRQTGTTLQRMRLFTSISIYPAASARLPALMSFSIQIICMHRCRVLEAQWRIFLIVMQSVADLWHRSCSFNPFLTHRLWPNGKHTGHRCGWRPKVFLRFGVICRPLTINSDHDEQKFGRECFSLYGLQLIVAMREYNFSKSFQIIAYFCFVMTTQSNILGLPPLLGFMNQIIDIA